MKVLPICMAVLAISGLGAGCQKREPTRPGEPTVTAAEERTPSAAAEPLRTTVGVGFAESLRKRHFELP
jgi:hypothetical protein